MGPGLHVGDMCLGTGTKWEIEMLPTKVEMPPRGTGRPLEQPGQVGAASETSRQTGSGAT